MSRRCWPCGTCVIHSARRLNIPSGPTPGLRGYAPGTALWWWGISEAEYERRADVWPLNPDGDLLAIAMIETADNGLKNADAIASVLGVGAIFVGVGNDLCRSI